LDTMHLQAGGHPPFSSPSWPVRSQLRPIDTGFCLTVCV
jgi:hypothetical protein